ncbi:acylphosphatase [Gracilibacillus marinus]|jgi:acylphosphatase|uniref:acylphosphatase n=1 Tax=Gracilibacillus marinus TaxID=630535 RepID=A0ABV8VVD1_9BACI
METKHLIVSGKVQGVGFRSFTQQTASKYNIVGTVKNLEDGNVEIVAQGTGEDITLFIKKIHKGPFWFAKVTNVEISDIDKTIEDKSFSIIY